MRPRFPFPAADVTLPGVPAPVLTSISQRLLPVLQLTRMALVFTAIADSTCGLLLRAARQRAFNHNRLIENVDIYQLAAIATISVGLYGYGMSLNDIIDRRRDSQIASHRPLPSGRIGVVTAHVICALLALGALCGAAYFVYSGAANAWATLVLVIATGLLITFYDSAGKYLVAPGLISLGLIRFFHAIIPAPEMPLLWHPLLLLNHVTILSTVAYLWEQKRPALTKLHWWTVLGMLAFIDAVAVGLTAWRRPFTFWIQPGLLLPAGAVLLFLVVALIVRKRMGLRREAGQTLMLYGLLWLIVYDAAFVAGYVNWIAAALLIMLMPVAYLSVQLMRWWSTLVVASRRPDYKRAGA
jgi:4-hydroxybenzoate polyprenyltransferase